MPFQHAQCQFRPTDVTSGRDRPCRYEENAASVKSSGICPYRSTCHFVSALRSLQFTYGTGIVATLAEPSSSPVVRSEYIFDPSVEYRETLRKHIFETPDIGGEKNTYLVSPETINSFREHVERDLGLNDKAPVTHMIEHLAKLTRGLANWLIEEFPSAQAEERFGRLLTNYPAEFQKVAKRNAIKVFGSPLNCVSRKESITLGRYLGFVDLRQYSSVGSIALALLVPPRELRHDRNAYIITGNYGETFGAHGFECSVYSMQDPTASDGKCVQTCIAMMLAMLSDRGARVVGTLDISAKGMVDVSPIPLTEQTELASKDYDVLYQNERRLIGKWIEKTNAVRLHSKVCSVKRLGGMGPTLAVATLKKLKTTPTYFFEGTFGEIGNPLFSQRLFLRLLDAYTQARCPSLVFVDPLILRKGENHSESDEKHCVLVVGLRRDSSHLNANSALFQRCPTEAILHDPSRAPFMIRSTELLIKASRAACGNNITAVFATSGAIQISATSIVDKIVNDHPSFLNRFMKPVSNRAVDYDIRLLNADSLQYYVCGMQAGASDAENSQFKILSQNNSERLSTFKQSHTGKPGWYWTVNGYSNNRLSHLVAYAANVSNVASPSIDLKFEDGND